MRILVTGAGGMPGSNIAAAAVQQSWDVLGLWHAAPAHVQGASASAVDLSDRRACVAVASGFEPDAIVHAAIAGGPGRFEREPGLAELARRGVEHTLAAARTVHARYVLVSCDWVFSGLRPPGERWDETDAPEPVNAYGRALEAAEEIVREADLDWLIVRTGDPYGVNLSRPIERRDLVRGHGARSHSERRSGELTGVHRQGALAEHVWERSGEAVRILARLRQARMALPAPADVRRSPTYAWDCAQRLCELIAQDRAGIYHLAGPDSVHRRKYLRTIAHAFGCAPTLVVEGDIASYLRALGEPAELALPPNTTLDSGRALAALGHPAVDMEAGLWLMGDQLRRALAR